MYIPQLKNTVLLKNTNHQTSLYQVVIFLLVERFVSMLMKMQLSEKHNKARYACDHWRINYPTLKDDITAWVMSSNSPSKEPNMRLEYLFKCCLRQKDFKTSLPYSSPRKSSSFHSTLHMMLHIIWSNHVCEPCLLKSQVP